MLSLNYSILATQNLAWKAADDYGRKGFSFAEQRFRREEEKHRPLQPLAYDNSSALSTFPRFEGSSVRGTENIASHADRATLYDIC